MGNGGSNYDSLKAEMAEPIKLRFCWKLSLEVRLIIVLKPKTPIVAKPLEVSSEASSILTFH